MLHSESGMEEENAGICLPWHAFTEANSMSYLILTAWRKISNLCVYSLLWPLFSWDQIRWPIVNQVNGMIHRKTLSLSRKESKTSYLLSSCYDFPSRKGSRVRDHLHKLDRENLKECIWGCQENWLTSLQSLPIIFENLWRSGEVPDDWKRVNVCPSMKKAKKSYWETTDQSAAFQSLA